MATEAPIQEQINTDPSSIRVPSGPYGDSEGGRPFYLFPTRGDAWVNRIEAWAGEVEEGYVVRAIRLHWKDGTSSEIAGEKGDLKDTIDYHIEDDEWITSMTIESGHFVDRIQFQTTKPRSSGIGGGGGKPHNVNCGDGRLYGMEGRCGKCIDQIKIWFNGTR